MRRSYLIFAFVAFVVWMILEKIDNELKWIAIGFGGVMLLFGIFSKDKVKPSEEQEVDNLNTPKEGNKNGI